MKILLIKAIHVDCPKGVKRIRVDTQEKETGLKLTHTFNGNIMKSRMDIIKRLEVVYPGYAVQGHETWQMQ